MPFSLDENASKEEENTLAPGGARNSSTSSPHINRPGYFPLKWEISWHAGFSEMESFAVEDSLSPEVCPSPPLPSSEKKSTLVQGFRFCSPDYVFLESVNVGFSFVCHAISFSPPFLIVRK